MRSADTRFVGLMLVVLLLAGCGGWQLRGMGESGNADLSQLRWRAGDDSAAMGEVLAVLRRAGMQPADDADAAGLVVELQPLSETRRSVSVTDRSRTAEYELISTLRYRVLGADGTELLAGAPLSEQRDYLVDRDNIMGSSREEEQLRADMHRQLGAALVRALAVALPSVAAP